MPSTAPNLTPQLIAQNTRALSEAQAQGDGPRIDSLYEQRQVVA